MMIKLGIVMDPIQSINIKKDSSFAMLEQAQARGYQLYYMEMNDLFLEKGVAKARVRQVKVRYDYQNWFEFLSDETLELA